MDIASNAEADTIHVRVTEALSAQDIRELRDTVDTFFNENDRAPSLLVEAQSAPHWDSVATLKEHLQLVMERQKLIRKVAVVGDAYALTIMPVLLDLFVSAKIRHFPSARLGEATEWAAAEDDHPGAFEVLEGFPRDVLALEAKGIITSQDYAELAPLVKAMLAEHDKVKVFIRIGDEFDRYTASALWDDARLGLGHMFQFGKIAIVSDIAWLTTGVKLFAPLMPSDVMVFSTEEEGTARSWIRS